MRRSRGYPVSAADDIGAWRAVRRRQFTRVHGQQRVDADSDSSTTILRAEHQLPGT